MTVNRGSRRLIQAFWTLSNKTIQEETPKKNQINKNSRKTHTKPNNSKRHDLRRVGNNPICKTTETNYTYTTSSLNNYSKYKNKNLPPKSQSTHIPQARVPPFNGNMFPSPASSKQIPSVCKTFSKNFSSSLTPVFAIRITNPIMFLLFCSVAGEWGNEALTFASNSEFWLTFFGEERTSISLSSSVSGVLKR